MEGSQIAHCIASALVQDLSASTPPDPFYVRPAWALSQGFKSRMVKAVVAIAKGKGVHREVGSEGSWRQISGLRNTNF
ncbi:hypothetical protein, partial [Paenibacillus plantiphilus]|uniref:hypothetical protein n=1 Tax=Paenibacillus plantiphilus TaxID=2905650 RepID=UPI001F31BB4A